MLLTLSLDQALETGLFDRPRRFLTATTSRLSFERTAFSWDLQHDHELRPALRMGIDGVYSDHVDRMVDAFARIYP